MSIEIALKQNILVTDFHLLKLSWDLVRRHLSVDLADKTFAVYYCTPVLWKFCISTLISTNHKTADQSNIKAVMYLIGKSSKNLHLQHVGDSSAPESWKKLK